jgi:hypothetical protein
MGIADDEFHSRHGREFFRGALRVAASYQDAGGGIFPMDTPYGLAYIVISFSRNGASVENHKVGGGPLTGGFEAAGGK